MQSALSLFSSAASYVIGRSVVEEPMQELQPLTMIFRECLLRFAPHGPVEGSKILLKNHTMQIQKPGFWTTYERTKQWRQLRNQIKLLKPRHVLAVTWYDPKQNSRMNQIYTWAIEGLRNLQDTYKNEVDNTGVAIDASILVIKNALEDKSQVHSDPLESKIREEISKNPKVKVVFETTLKGLKEEFDNEKKESNKHALQHYIKIFESALKEDVHQKTLEDQAKDAIQSVCTLDPAIKSVFEFAISGLEKVSSKLTEGSDEALHLQRQMEMIDDAIPVEEIKKTNPTADQMSKSIWNEERIERVFGMFKELEKKRLMGFNVGNDTYDAIEKLLDEYDNEYLQKRRSLFE